MPEAKTVTFSNREVAAALLKQSDIHEGLWGIYVEFGIAAANIGDKANEDTMLPAAIVPIVKLGIQRFDSANSLTVDAAEVNPLKKKPTKAKRAAK